jgi:hypothetical protein
MGWKGRVLSELQNDLLILNCNFEERAFLFKEIYLLLENKYVPET